MNLSAGMPPRITVPPVEQRVADGEIASFLCIAEGNPAPEVTWYLGDRKITTKGRFMIVPIEGEPGGNKRGSVLRLEHTRGKKDDGTFECRAENGQGEPIVATAILSVYPEGKGMFRGLIVSRPSQHCFCEIGIKQFLFKKHVLEKRIKCLINLGDYYK